MKALIATLLALVLAVPTYSEPFLDMLRRSEPGKGTVTVTQAPEIDQLVNGTGGVAGDVAPTPRAGDVAPSPQRQPCPAADSPRAGHLPPSASAPSAPANSATASEQSTPDTGDDTTPDMRKKVMRNSYKTQGYRVQVFSGGNSRLDRQKAETAGAAMKRHLPSEPVYVHFYSPSWKCRIGNYKTIEEARAILAQVKRHGYPQACIVKGTISVQY